jgi:hypothetical protein
MGKIQIGSNVSHILFCCLLFIDVTGDAKLSDHRTRGKNNFITINLWQETC